MAGPSLISNLPVPISQGLAVQSGDNLLAIAKSAMGAQSGLTAGAGGGAAAATPLGQNINFVSVSATVGDSLLLPLALPGSMCWVIVSAVHAPTVWPQQSNPQNGGVADVIYAAGNSTPLTSQAIGNSGVNYYICGALGIWKSVLI